MNITCEEEKEEEEGGLKRSMKNVYTLLHISHVGRLDSVGSFSLNGYADELSQ